jgi:GNAT superfamily N-acetyltransferase
VGLRKTDTGVCEMKRLFVKPGYRGKGVGRVLAEKTIREAKKLGYKKMRLDTMDWLKEAVRLYESLGFQQIPPYYHNPISGAAFWELNL